MHRFSNSAGRMVSSLFIKYSQVSCSISHRESGSSCSSLLERSSQLRRVGVIVGGVVIRCVREKIQDAPAE
jgi:hypothetical protein